MSGIYGVYRYDGAPVDPRWLERMKEAMAYYGPDGGACQIHGPVGMGHLLLKINPEDAFDCQPAARRTWSGGKSPHGWITAMRCWKSSTWHLRMRRRISDGHLVSLAFDRWGEDSLLAP